jgi:hypothetical protein
VHGPQKRQKTVFLASLQGSIMAKSPHNRHLTVHHGTHSRRHSTAGATLYGIRRTAAGGPSYHGTIVPSWLVFFCLSLIIFSLMPRLTSIYDGTICASLPYFQQMV